MSIILWLQHWAAQTFNFKAEEWTTSQIFLSISKNEAILAVLKKLVPHILFASHLVPAG